MSLFHQKFLSHFCQVVPLFFLSGFHLFLNYFSQSQAFFSSFSKSIYLVSNFSRLVRFCLFIFKYIFLKNFMINHCKSWTFMSLCVLLVLRLYFGLDITNFLGISSFRKYLELLDINCIF